MSDRNTRQRCKARGERGGIVNRSRRLPPGGEKRVRRKKPPYMHMVAGRCASVIMENVGREETLCENIRPSEATAAAPPKRGEVG